MRINLSKLTTMKHMLQNKVYYAAHVCGHFIEKSTSSEVLFLVPLIGFEPIWHCCRGILSCVFVILYTLVKRRKAAWILDFLCFDFVLYSQLIACFCRKLVQN